MVDADQRFERGQVDHCAIAVAYVADEEEARRNSRCKSVPCGVYDREAAPVISVQLLTPFWELCQLQVRPVTPRSGSSSVAVKN